MLNISKTVKLAETYADVSESELARRMNTSPQALGQRLKTGKLDSEYLERIAAALGAEAHFSFVFPDGKTIE